MTTKIQWCDSTVNPVSGCAGCELWTNVGAKPRHICYAGTLHEKRKGMKGYAPKFELPALFRGRMNKAAGFSDLTGKIRSGPVAKPWLDGLPRLIFVSDMGDALSPGQFVHSEDLEPYSVPGKKRQRHRPAEGSVQEGGVPFEFLHSEIIEAVTTPKGQRHNWLWLTKQVPRMKQFADWLTEQGVEWPENLWIGTTIASKATEKRAEQLAQIGDDRTTRFLSMEPLWEDVSLQDLLPSGKIHWVIVTGESRQANGEANEFKVEWARSLRDECKDHNVPFFVKQLGANATDGGRRLCMKKAHGDDWEEWPKDVKIREVPQPAPTTS